MPDSTAAGAVGQSVRIEQRAVLSSFLGLSLKNGPLNLVTLTLYRFWGKTEVRRRVWRSTFLNDEPFEYTGRGVELFVGFLLALLLVGGPFLFIVFGAQFAASGSRSGAPRATMGRSISVTASSPAGRSAGSGPPLSGALPSRSGTACASATGSSASAWPRPARSASTVHSRSPGSAGS
jgi:hypothetical protein